jgi:hypothetical protein
MGSGRIEFVMLDIVLRIVRHELIPLVLGFGFGSKLAFGLGRHLLLGDSDFALGLGGCGSDRLKAWLWSWLGTCLLGSWGELGRSNYWLRLGRSLGSWGGLGS